MYRSGETSTATYDDDDERAARWTLRLLAVALFVAVVSVTIFVSILTLRDDAPSATHGHHPSAGDGHHPAPAHRGRAAAGHRAGRLRDVRGKRRWPR